MSLKKRSNVTETTKAIDKRRVWNSGIVLVGVGELVEDAYVGREGVVVGVLEVGDGEVLGGAVGVGEDIGVGCEKL